MSKIHFSWLLPLLLLVGSVDVAYAQAVDPVDEPTARIEAAAAQVRAVDRALDEQVTPQRRDAMRKDIDSAQTAAASATAALQAQLALVDARVGQLGPVTPGIIEAPDIQAQRRLLSQQRATIDSAVKRGRLVDIEAKQLLNEIAANQAEQLSAQITARVASPASPDFWQTLSQNARRDVGRTLRFVAVGVAGLERGLHDGQPSIAAAALALASVFLGPVQLALRRAGRRRMIDGAPGHRVRRSGYALWRVAVATIVPGLAATILVQGLRWSGMVAPPWEPVVATFIWSSFIAALVAALGGTLLMPEHASWRLLPLSDTAAERLQPWVWFLAALALVTPVVDAFGTALGASTVATLLADDIEVVLHIAFISGVLVTLGRLRAETERSSVRLRAETERSSDVDETPSHAGIGILTLATWLAVLVCVGALLLGFVAFSLFNARLIAWCAIVAAALYLLLVAADDIATTTLAGDSRIGHALHRGFGLRRSAIDQIGVLVSAAIRVMLTLLAIGLLLSPFGSGVGSMFDRVGVLAQGVTIGQVTISPGAILRALLILGVGLTIVRLFQRWLTNRYLPMTELDRSARNSVSLVARYTGMLFVALWGLAALGIGFERIALLLSALSVGIGFGLQAITQNFISGLILLAERPVKIGDLVRIGNDEGDVRRISVRSTEIELADHSTLIVPNSELITKTVLNKTHASPLGRIQLEFSVPLGTDAVRVRTVVLDIFAAEKAILADPAPVAFVDGIADGRIRFNCFAHVAGPRDVYPARSSVLLALLEHFRRENIDIGTVPQRLELASGVRAELEGANAKTSTTPN